MGIIAYYGYRNPSCEDGRWVLKPEWFRGRDVLDLGCNVGHLTLSIARESGAHPAWWAWISMPQLIHSARQNIRILPVWKNCVCHPRLSEGSPEQRVRKGPWPSEKELLPASLTASRGPTLHPKCSLDGADTGSSPNNVVFLLTVRGSPGSWE